MSTTILALDLGTQTGWAIRLKDGQIISDSETFKPQRFEGGGMRYLRFRKWLTEIKQSGDGIDAAAPDKPTLSSAQARATAKQRRGRMRAPPGNTA